MVYRINAEIKKIAEKYVRKKEKREGQDCLYIHWWIMGGTCCKGNYSESLEGSLMLVFPCVLIFEIIEPSG